MQPTLALDDAGALPLVAHGSTTTGVLAAAEAIASAAAPGAVVLGDDFGDDLDAASAEYLASRLRRNSGQVWLSTRRPEVVHAFPAEEMVRLTRSHGARRLETFRDRLFTEIFPGRSTVPKTLIFCKDDAHAEEDVTRIREVFGKGNDFAAKITYSAKDPKGQLQAFRTSATLRVAVTVDMIATGTDVKPLECVFFLRDVRSAAYFEQMKGRGARTIPSAHFQAVTPDAADKTRFVVVDAIGVTEHEFVEPPLNRKLSHLDYRAALIRINQIQRGWANYFQHAVAKHTFARLATFVWWRMVRWVMHRNRITWKTIRR